MRGGREHFRMEADRTAGESRGGWIEPVSRAFPVAVLLLALAAFFTVYFARLNWPPVRSDGVGYYAYLPAFFIHHDPGFEGLTAPLANYYRIDPPAEIPDWTGIQRHPATGRYLNKYPMGVALMAAPMFFAAHAMSLLLEQPADGFAPLYQFAVAVSGLLYAVLGLLLLQRLLEAEFGRGAALAAVAALLFGTNLFHYATYDSLFSHAFSFFLVVALLALTRAWARQPTLACAAALGAVGGLLALVRFPNVAFLLLVPLYGGIGRGELVRRVEPWVRLPPALPLAGFAFAATISPQFIYWKYAAGSWLIQAYQDEGFNFLRPHVLEVLFSVRKGLFFWSPLLLLGVAGMALPRFRRSPYALLVAGLLALQIYVIASWWNWWYGGSFGHRGFVESLPLFAIPLAALYASLPNRAWRASVFLLCAAMIALNLIQMIQYWKRILPFDGMTWEIYRSAFLQIMRGA
jgi:hypothetical protein